MVDILGPIDYDRIREKVSAAFQYDTVGNVKMDIANAEVVVPIQVVSKYKEAITLLASGARTASGNSSNIDVRYVDSADILINVTAVSGTNPELVVAVKGLDEITGVWKTLVVTDPITAVGQYWLQLEPIRFRVIRVDYTVTGTTPSFTFSVTGQFMSR